MTDVLQTRKYRLAGRLLADLAGGTGLWVAAAFAASTAALWALNPAGEAVAATLALTSTALTIAVAVLCGVSFYRSLQTAVAVGFTRGEFLAAFAVFGAAVVAATAALVQGAKLAGDLITGVDGGFYGGTLGGSLSRAALYVTAGALIAALILRLDRRPVSGVFVGLVLAVVVFRQMPLEIALEEIRPTDADQTLVLIEFPGTQPLLVPVDAILSCVFIAGTWALAARAPLASKRA